MIENKKRKTKAHQSRERRIGVRQGCVVGRRPGPGERRDDGDDTSAGNDASLIVTVTF